MRIHERTVYIEVHENKSPFKRVPQPGVRVTDPINSWWVATYESREAFGQAEPLQQELMTMFIMSQWIRDIFRYELIGRPEVLARLFDTFKQELRERE